MKSLVLIALILFIAPTLFAQSSAEHFKSALFPTKEGAEVVYSSDHLSLTLDIVSTKMKPLQKPGYVLVDNKILQFSFIGNNAFKQNGNTDEEEKVQLIEYMQYELNYIKNEVKMDYTDLFHDWIVINNKVFLLWGYSMPVTKEEKDTPVVKQINLSSLNFNHVLNLNTPFIKDDNFDDDKGLLLKVAKTLKQNEFKIDFDELYQKLNRGKD